VKLIWALPIIQGSSTVFQMSLFWNDTVYPYVPMLVNVYIFLLVLHISGYIEVTKFCLDMARVRC